MNLLTISNVRGYTENGMGFLHLEDVARGLGFTQSKNGIEYVRWETVTAHLQDIGFSQLVGKDTFIPENIFYRLAMKAKNETAEAFQAKVADEILPTIRKTGSYTAEKPKSQAELLLMYAQGFVEMEQRMTKFETTVTAIQDTFLQRDDDWRKSINTMINQAAYRTGKPYQDVRRDSYKQLEERGHCKLDTRLRNLTERLQDAGATKTQIREANKMDVIESDPRLKEIYTTIVKEKSIGSLRVVGD